MMCFQEPDRDVAVPRALSPSGVFASIAITLAATLLFGFIAESRIGADKLDGEPAASVTFPEELSGAGLV